MAAHWIEFGKVALAHLLAVASPGPDFALVLRQSLRHGRRTAIWSSCGVGTAVLLHTTYSTLGLGLLVSGSRWWFDILKWVGALYLAWMGWNALRVKPRNDHLESAEARETPRNRSAFAVGFLTNALNPKATLFFVALFSVVIDPATPRYIQAGYGLWMAGATAGWFTLVSILFTRESLRQPFLRYGHWIDRALGVVFLAFALSLALASR